MNDLPHSISSPRARAPRAAIRRSRLPALPLAILVLAFCPALFAQEALRSSMAGEAAARARRQQQLDPAYTIKSGDFRLLVTPSLNLEWNDNIITSDEDPRDDFLVRPFVALRGSYPLTAQNVLNLSVGLGYDWYTQNDEYSAWRVQSGSELAFDLYIKDIWINLHDRFSYVQDATREAAVAGTARYGNLENTVGVLATWDLSDITLSFGYDHENVISQTSRFQQQDRASELLVARGGFQLHPKIMAGLEATGSFTDYVEPILNDNTGYSIGA
jgi:hypothetical protein